MIEMSEKENKSCFSCSNIGICKIFEKVNNAINNKVINDELNILIVLAKECSRFESFE